MSNAITFPDHDYLGDAITLTDDAPPADELQALRAQIEALTKERDELLWALRWATSRESRVHYIGNDDATFALSETQWRNNEKLNAILDKYATTAPTAGA